MKKACHIVFTTIHQPTILRDLYENIQRHGHLEEVKVWVVGDRKTPSSAVALAEEVTGQGLETVYFDIDAQDEWGRQFPFYPLIPYNTDGRRVFGYLKALEEGCELLISIDDDNFPTARRLRGSSPETGQRWRQPVVKEESRFYNICEHLVFEPSRLVFPRGFPFQLRGQANQERPAPCPEGAAIGVTEGLWLDDPDVDATTWLNGKVKGVDYRGPDAFVLEQSTWSPINTQNTSVVRELIPAFVFVTMAWPVPGGKLDRYGDIWGGYFLLALDAGHQVSRGVWTPAGRTPAEPAQLRRRSSLRVLGDDPHGLAARYPPQLIQTGEQQYDGASPGAGGFPGGGSRHLSAGLVPPRNCHLPPFHRQESSTVVGGVRTGGGLIAD